MSLAHFFVLDFNFFDDPEIYKRTTLKKLEAAALSVRALAEMFSVKLKFTVDCLKAWFEKNHKIIEIDIDQKFKFIRENPIKKDSPCCLCDFPIDPKVENGWLDHVLKPEYLFLENTYSDDQMKKMKIEKLELFKKKIKKIFDNLNDFCESIEQEYKDNPDIEIVSELKKIKTSWEDEEKVTKEKAIQYMYERSICFIPTSTVKGKYPISSKFISNLIAIFKGQRDIHHSHVTGKTIGYAYNFRNLRCKENYYTMPAFAHNQFRFDFFFYF